MDNHSKGFPIVLEAQDDRGKAIKRHESKKGPSKYPDPFTRAIQKQYFLVQVRSHSLDLLIRHIY